MKRAVAYLRRSTDRQEQSIEDQRRYIRDWAEKNGYTIIREFADDASGASADEREGFLQMIAFAENPDNRVQAVLVYDISRFGRTDTDEAGYYRYRLRRAGVEVIYCAENLPADRIGDLIRDIKQWQKREFLIDLSRDTIRGLVSRAEQGFWNGGLPPYGYLRCVVSADGKHRRVIRNGEKIWKEKSDRITLVPDEEKAETVRWIFRTYATGRFGFKQIACMLNRKGIPSPSGGPWRATTIRNILSNPTYTGTLVYNRRAMSRFHCIRNRKPAPKEKPLKVVLNPPEEWITVPNAHPAIVEPELFERVQRILQQHRRNCNKERLRSHFLLSGLVVCGHCGGLMHGQTLTRRKNGKAYRYRRYICGSYHTTGSAVCAYNAIPAEPLEKFVLQQIKDELLRPDVLREIERRLSRRIRSQKNSAPRLAARVKLRIAAINSKINLLLENISPDNIRLIDAKLTELRRQRDALEQQLQELEERKRTQEAEEELLERIKETIRNLQMYLEEGTVDMVKDVVRRFVERIALFFEERETNGRRKRVFVRGDLKMLTLSGVIAGCSQENRGGGI